MHLPPMWVYMAVLSTQSRGFPPRPFTDQHIEHPGALDPRYAMQRKSRTLCLAFVITRLLRIMT
jgi:hypothetical protein